MSLIIRAATIADQPTITTLVRSAHLNPLRIAWPNFVIAETLPARTTVGIAQLRPHGSDLELASLVVTPEQRRTGVGAALVTTLLHRAPGPLYLMCEGALTTYYTRFGFREVARLADIPAGMRAQAAVGRLLGPLFSQVQGKPMRLAVMAHPGVNATS